MSASPSKAKRFSGIYPHLAWTNGSADEYEWECGAGAVVPWAGKLWFLTYPAHKPFGSRDKLVALHPDLTVEVCPESVGGTHACRMIHRESEQLIIGPYFIDRDGNVRAVPPAKMEGRLTGVARHLTDPANKVIFYTMESGLYEVDVHTLEVTTLYRDPNHTQPFAYLLPGVHGKGAYSGQGVLVVSNNGLGGVLAEWDGKGNPADRANWTIVDRNKYTEITGPGGLYGAPDDQAPIWALGWDDKSVLLNVRQNSRWTRFRLPMGSYTHSADDGWFTEWPRIREIGRDQWLMDMFGMLFEFPPTFSAENRAGIRPVAVHHKMIIDFAEWNGQLVMGCNDASIQNNPLTGRCQSNLLFTDFDKLKSFGKPGGWGRVWSHENVEAGAVSEAFHFAGYEQRVLHLSHREGKTVRFAIETDERGNGHWSQYRTVEVPETGYAYIVFPENLQAEWVRVAALEPASGVSAGFVYTPASGNPRNEALVAGLADAGSPAPASECILFATNDLRLPLHVAAAGSTGLYEVTADAAGISFKRIENPGIEQRLRTELAPACDFEVDRASVIVKDKKGRRFRLPKGHRAFDRPSSAGFRRGIREVVTERSLMNIHGAFYELPDERSGGMRCIQPVCTHNKLIYDFCSWRGMLVLSGVLMDGRNSGNAGNGGQVAGVDGPADPAGGHDGRHRDDDGGPCDGPIDGQTGFETATESHIVYSDDGKVGLWFGNVDDLRSFGAPSGAGGPWFESDVPAGVPSDPYLMAGYLHKKLELSHDQDTAVAFTIEVDFQADDTWAIYDTVSVPPGTTLEIVFPQGYSAHWVRLTANRNARATAIFYYS